MLANGCCVDPVTYERIDDEMKNWIWKKAPGVRESRGCPKKKSRMYITYIFFLDPIGSLVFSVLVSELATKLD